MRVGFKAHHFKDDKGHPAGGHTYGNGFAIAWQQGPLGRGEDRKEPNGAFVEDIIHAAADRIAFYETSEFACTENRAALMHLSEALEILDNRTKNREARGVEGTHEKP